MINDLNAQQEACPVCATRNGKYYIPINQFKIYKCSNCGLEHTYPIPSDTQLKLFYSTYTDFRAASSVVKLNAKRNVEILSSFGFDENKSLLDFGAGDGDFVEAAGKNCFGVDFKSATKPRLYQNLSDLPIKKFDFITLWGVLEHLANPAEVIWELSSYLNVNGIVAITTVNAEGIIPYYYKPVEHLTYWTNNSFEYLFKKVGIKIIEYKPYTMMQSPEIYIDRLISRTPSEYKHAFQTSASLLPEYIEIPTNEVIVIGKLTA